jgi:hypothetical protein
LFRHVLARKFSQLMQRCVNSTRFGLEALPRLYGHRQSRKLVFSEHVYVSGRYSNAYGGDNVANSDQLHCSVWGDGLGEIHHRESDGVLISDDVHPEASGLFCFVDDPADICDHW